MITIKFTEKELNILFMMCTNLYKSEELKQEKGLEGTEKEQSKVIMKFFDTIKYKLAKGLMKTKRIQELYRKQLGEI